MKVVDGFRERAKSVEAMTNKLFLELLEVGLSRVDDFSSNSLQVSEDTTKGTLGLRNNARDLLRETGKDVTNTTTAEATKNSAQTLVEKVLTQSCNSVLDGGQEFVEDGANFNTTTTDDAGELAENTLEETLNLTLNLSQQLLKNFVQVEVGEKASSTERGSQVTELVDSSLSKSSDLLLELTKKGLSGSLTSLDELTDQLVQWV